MSAPFRELFAELPRALFESLQAIDWDAAAAAHRGHGVRRPDALAHSFKSDYRPTPRLVSQDYVRHVFARYGWTDAEVRRCPAITQTELIAWLACGHRVVYRIDEIELHRTANAQGELALLDRLVDREPRRCCCVPRPD